ncbi:MFS transporter [Gracilimonas mengyeensis]|uniref:Predicted arabinose efflux permease, MFS family n=1 Tax=Gracilimonas mengyeensis TaxID=1302730 RepID=A0A521DGY2_9BACT|nr:MFS transporter [Gracilimonas mengyeensis]SMO70886.1 Predicted arabinose efflux permease, MFS family [Gracilimonas mengyeensis]
MTQSPQNQKAGLLKDLNLYIIFGITLTAVMGVSSIAPAFPSISDALDVSATRIGLLITFFTIPGIVITPVLGLLADRFGRKVVLVPSLLLFGVAGTACAFAASFEQMLLFRALQGAGSASLGALNLTLIGDLYSSNDRATAMGYNGSVLSIGTAFYPAIGGALAILGWHYPFYLSLIAIPVGIFVLFGLEKTNSTQSLNVKEIFSNVASSLVSKKVLPLFAGIFFTFIMLYGGYITYFTILLDEKFGQNSFRIGIILSGSSFVTAYAASQLGNLTQRFSEVTLIRVAAILYLAMFLYIPVVDNIWWFILPVAVFGAAQGINLPSLLNLLTGYADKEYRAAFLSVNWVVMRTGQAIGPYVLGLVYSLVSLQGTFYAAAIAGALFVITAFFFMKPEWYEPSQDTEVFSD